MESEGNDNSQGEVRHGIPIVPQKVHVGLGSLPASKEKMYAPGSFGDLIGLVGKDVTFWRPGIMELSRALGWGWLLMLPALVLFVSPLIVMIIWGLQSPFLGMSLAGSKLLILAGGIILSLIAWSMRKAMKGRTTPFCIHCGYDLAESPAEGICPECGRRYIPGLWEEYRKDPAFFVRRYRQLGKHPVGVILDVGTSQKQGGDGM